RLPVYDKTIDNIVGVINEKDFFKLIMSGEKSIESIITNTLYISDLRLISEVLRDMQKEKIHMAIVVDQYGGTQGIVTMEDIIEELVGEIYDENDEVVHTLVKVSDGIFEVSGELSIDDMLEQLELPLNLIDSESTSVGGWIMELFGKIPTEDDEISSGIFTIKVLKMTDQKVDLVKISFNEINS
ncbi:MAG: transporter associated domain-containing protein, partial [Oscillospiraceae bacterium]